MSDKFKYALMYAEELQKQEKRREEDRKRREKFLRDEELKKENFLKLKELQKDIKNLFQWTVCPMKYSLFTGIAWATSEEEVKEMLISKYKHFQDYEGDLKMSVSRVNLDDALIEISNYIE